MSRAEVCGVVCPNCPGECSMGPGHREAHFCGYCASSWPRVLNGPDDLGDVMP